MKYAKFSDDFLSYFRLDNNGEILVLTDKRGYTRAVKLLPYEERPQGEWIKHIDNLFPEESTEECSICHEEQFLNRGNDDNFCPNCGADMRKGGDPDEDS